MLPWLAGWLAPPTPAPAPVVAREPDRYGAATPSVSSSTVKTREKEREPC